MADQLATPQDLASLLQRDWAALTAAQQATMTLLVEAGTAVVQNAAGGQRIQQVVNDTVDVIGGTGSWLPLPQWPVTAVSSVIYNGSALVEGADYKRSRSRLWRRDGWTECPDEPYPATVVYIHGYPDGAQELQFARSAVLGLIRDVYGNPGGLKAQSVDDWSATYSALSAHMDGSPTLRAALRRQYGRRR